jgi:hypothetical protein
MVRVAGKKKGAADQEQPAVDPSVAELELLSQPSPSAGPTPPTDVQMAAIIGAAEALWPKPTVEADVTNTADAVWKFANRWWHGAGVAQRGRPRRPRPS